MEGSGPVAIHLKRRGAGWPVVTGRKERKEGDCSARKIRRGTRREEEKRKERRNEGRKGEARGKKGRVQSRGAVKTSLTLRVRVRR
jgi:hypothetical protein